MAFTHGKNTVVKLDGNDLSTYTDSSDYERTADSHDVTAYGKDAHVKQGGLLDGTFKMSGTYDNTVGGPRAVIQPLIGQVVTFIRQPEGTGSGKPQDTGDVLITKYTESNPVADMVKWTVEGELSDTVDSTAQ